MEACPICQRKFPLAALPQHVDDCLSGGGGQSSDHDADLELALKLQADMERETSARTQKPPTTSQPVTVSHHESDEEFARRLQAEFSGQGSSSTTSSTPSAKPHDADAEFARKLQEEEEASRPSGVDCQICKQKVSADKLFILDECSHKFCKTCLRNYVLGAVQKSATTLCPVEGCKAAFSVRDMKELLPKSSDMVPQGGSKKATERLLSEYSQIIKSDPKTQGYSVKPVKDNMYHWEVKFFDFDKNDPLGQDLAKSKHKAIILHVTFPQTYPFNPPFIRVIRPRFAFRTGHVTIGGSICTEMLTNSGWTPANTVESALVSIRANLILGGARLDTHTRGDYSESEAREAFERMRREHGW